MIAAEKITDLIDWNDRSTCVLFGDGAGACVLGEVEEVPDAGAAEQGGARNEPPQTGFDEIRHRGRGYHPPGAPRIRRAGTGEMWHDIGLR